MRKAFFFLIFIGVFCSSLNCMNKKDNKTFPKTSKEKLESQIIEVKKLVNGNSKYNAEIGFFIDMKIASGKNRFFIYDLKNNKLLDKGLVGHGSGSETGIPGKLKFSNTKNSLCTSLGKYSIGYSYKGIFGKAYKLYGLDKTNSNAFDRNIVLHKYFDIPFEEQENEICNSYGCPMVNERFFGVLEKIIDNSKKKIILTIYY
ncbi:murein L,D-transpeptidase catalytic domain-containing protein [Flavobacterium aestivum]|uniref:murein L,D-transpeptidase catalytic domain-containing protein n=1 Tax=Flavobacterium aestivum TaxID=3003257 RepID=UPI0024827199|nr:murein L,D-transpeptidase catalytic domain family protein [Flavobacterium aestivum]